jgi:hypothetical protein
VTTPFDQTNQAYWDTKKELDLAQARVAQLEEQLRDRVKDHTREDEHFKQRMAEMIFVAMHVGIGPASVRDYMGGRASGAYDAAEAFVTEMKRRGGRPS